MKFKFYPKESKLYDFLRFPRLLFYREAYEEFKKDSNFSRLNIDEYLEFVKKVEDRLNPFIVDFDMFYSKPFLNDYNFIDLITRTETTFGYNDEKEFLDSLLNLTEDETNKNIISSLILINEEHEIYSEKIEKQAEKISSSKDKMVSFIKDLPIDSGLKWNLFLMIEEPIKYTKQYVELMLKILPIFYEFYSPLNDKVLEYGNYLVDYLNTEGPKGLGELTDSVIDSKIIDTEEVNILVSVVFSYAISLLPRGKESYIAWGLKMEDAFRQIKEINENKTNERVHIFKNLGDKTRYEVLKLIASGETSTKIIAETLGVSSATISYHINNFLTSKVIKMDKIDNKYGYVVDYELLNRTLEEFKEDLRFPQRNS